MTKSAKQKREIRARKDRTGESYTEARRHVVGLEVQATATVPDRGAPEGGNPNTPYLTIWNMPPEQYQLLAPAFQGYLSGVVRPVVCRPEGSAGHRKAEVGSALVLRVGDEHVLLTAGHNLQEDGVNKVIGLTPGGPIREETIRWLGPPRGALAAEPVELTHQRTGEVRHAKIDLALVQLTEEEVKFGGFTPVVLDQLEDWTIEQGEIVMLVGYPGELYLGRDGDAPTPRFLALPTIGVHESEWAPGWYPGIHQVVRYPMTPDEVTLMITPGGPVPAKLPDPHGISGCGLWKIAVREGKIFSHKDLRLVGIQCSWNERRQLLLGNDIMTALHVLVRTLPGAANIIKGHGFKAA